jgi:transcription elongation factor SPT5
MASILDQNFGDDDSDEGEDFNPLPANDSDVEDAGRDDGKSVRKNKRPEARREKSRTPGGGQRDANDSPEPARANVRKDRNVEDEDNGEDDEGEGEDLNGDDDEEDEEDEEDEDIASVSSAMSATMSLR